MADSPLLQWLQRLQNAHPVEIEMGLERVDLVWQQLSTVLGVDPQTPFSAPIVTVAGTNGKGSTVAALESLALSNGLRPACYTSPHLISFTERIRVAGCAVSEGELVEALELVESARAGTALTFFEHTTLACLALFVRSCADLVILEVGLGGRLDAVNIIDADVAVLTSIDLDHQDFLGDNRSAIAREKLGIARAGKPLVIGEQDYPEGFLEAVTATSAKPLWLGKEFNCEIDDDVWHYRAFGEEILDIRRGPLLPINLTLAVTAYRQLSLPFSAANCADLLAAVTATGRQQRLRYHGRELLLDVAHNPASCQQLAAALQRQDRPAVAVVSAFADKDFVAMVEPLLTAVGHWWVAPIKDNSRAADPHKLSQLLYNSGASTTCSFSLPQALEAACVDSSEDHLIVVMGSFMVVAEILMHITEEEL